MPFPSMISPTIFLVFTASFSLLTCQNFGVMILNNKHHRKIQSAIQQIFTITFLQLPCIGSNQTPTERKMKSQPDYAADVLFLCPKIYKTGKRKAMARETSKSKHDGTMARANKPAAKRVTVRVSSQQNHGFLDYNFWVCL